MPSAQEELKGKVDLLGKAFEEFKKSNDKSIEELKTKGVVDPTLQAKVDKSNEAIDLVTKEIEQIKVVINRKAVPSHITDEKQLKMYDRYKGTHPFLFKDGQFDEKSYDEYKDGMRTYIRSGRQEKSLLVGSDPNGGYLVRPEVGELLQTELQEISPFRQYCGNISISTDAFEAPTTSGAMKGRRVGEVDARSTRDAAPKFGQLRFETPEMIVSPEASQKFLEDASVDVESWLAMKAAEGFALKEGEEIVNGSGVGMIQGFLQAGCEEINSGSATLVQADGLINLEAALKTAYKQSAVWFMNRKTIAAVRKLKNGSGDYLWQPGLREGSPNTLIGHPLVEAPDMPDVGSAATPIAFGDFRRGFLIVDRIGTRLLRDPYTNKPFVIFDFTRRVGGGVQVTEAIKIQKLATI
jgi:HK97 family phage major capsid protein